MEKIFISYSHDLQEHSDRVLALALPASLTIDSLRHPHGSIARNHRLCEALFLAKYIEKYGTGTLMMIRECLAHNLPEPDFAQRGSEFTITLWRDWLSSEVLVEFHLNDRQLQAIAFLKINKRITSHEYRQITGVIPKTATRDLDGLIEKGLIVRIGEKRGSYYVLSKRRK
ncbi:MAG TPA: ATP-binding protein [Candidatus Deferrimicrobium sp.]|nr:ATP-binding protein [Candidatus Deferrimicrobium sp.]